VAIARVEQLFPWPTAELVDVLGRYPRLTEVVWVQEEPENMGAWEFARPALAELAGPRAFSVLARPRSSSPAEGSAARHHQNQERLIAAAFAPAGELSTPAASRKATRKPRAAASVKAGVS
jgi:2-oxoglutarate dehydrogenase E1 component